MKRPFTTFLKKLLLFTVIVYLLNLAFGHVLQTRKRYTERNGINPIFNRWNDYYTQKELNAVFIGPSQVHRGIDPRVFDSITGLHSFNQGSPFQSIKTSYYILKEVSDHHPLKFAFLDMQNFSLCYTQPDIPYGSEIYRYMHSGKAKQEMLMNGFTLKEQLVLFLLPSVEYKNDLYFVTSRQFMKQVQPEMAANQYYPRGFYNSHVTMSLNAFAAGSAMQDYPFVSPPKENLEYLNKIRDLCKEKGIQLIVYTSPLAQHTFDSIKGKEHMADSIGTHVKGVTDHYLYMMDLNRSQLNDTLHYCDALHLNYEGAKIFTRALADTFKATMQR